MRLFADQDAVLVEARRAAQEPAAVMRVLGLSDRMFAELVDEAELRSSKGQVPVALMLRIVEDVFGMQRIELALGDDFERFFNALCRYETVTISAPRYVIAAARYVTDDFENADVFTDHCGTHRRHIEDIEAQIPGFTEALRYREKAEIAVRGRIG